MSRAASLPGAELFLKNDFFLNKPLVRGSCAAWGRTCSQKMLFFLNKPLVLGSFAARSRTFSLKQLCVFFVANHLSRAASLPGAELFQKQTIFSFEEATCPGQLRCLGQNCLSKNELFLSKPLVPGSFAAWGRIVSQESIF